MRVLIRHRDAGSRRLLGMLTPLVPEIELLECMPGEPVEPLEDVDVVIAVGPVGREAMERGRFKLIQTVGTGYDNVDVAAATELGIAVANMPASKTGNAESVAEHAILLLLALGRQLGKAQSGLREHRWGQPLGVALLGKRACLVGLGAVGTALAERLHAFGVQIVATRRDVAKGGPPFVRVLSSGDLPEAVAVADFVILCARADDENRDVVNAGLLARMKPGVLLVNIARGSLVDHDALLAALRSGQVRGAGLDVFWEEPANPDHPLFALDNVIATPHIAGVTDVNMSRTMKLLAANLRRYARGEAPEFVVNHPRANPST